MWQVIVCLLPHVALQARLDGVPDEQAAGDLVRIPRRERSSAASGSRPLENSSDAKVCDEADDGWWLWWWC